jgi:hypothetical protein
MPAFFIALNHFVIVACVGARPARCVKWSFSSLSMGTTLLFAVTLPSIGSLSPCIFNTLLYFG